MESKRTTWNLRLSKEIFPGHIPKTVSVQAPFTSGAAGPQESAGAVHALLLPAVVARVATTAVFTGFVWELSVGLWNSWEFLSNCIPWGWREAKDNSLSQGLKRGQYRKSGEAAPEWSSSQRAELEGQPEGRDCSSYDTKGGTPELYCTQGSPVNSRKRGHSKSILVSLFAILELHNLKVK